jgi:hypothetical protein
MKNEVWFIGDDFAFSASMAFLINSLETPFNATLDTVRPV